LYSSSNIIRVIISRMAGYVAHIEDVKNAYKILVRNLKGRVHLEVLGIDGG